MKPLATFQDSKLLFSGNWVASQIQEFDTEYWLAQLSATEHVDMDLSQVIALDSTGAWCIQKLVSALRQQHKSVELQHVADRWRQLFELIAQKIPEVTSKKPVRRQEKFLVRVGMQALEGLQQGFAFLEFVGELSVLTLRFFGKHARFRINSMIGTIYHTGFTALPIIGLLSFLIGIVLAYQMGLQLRNYGANIYIVDFLGLSTLREFAPMITAIIVAGRTSSAFTSEISTMKINEEIDALYTLGVAPADFLVVPKVIGLMIALPLLIVWADIFGIFGGMMMSHIFLKINSGDFLVRFAQYVPVRAFVIGLSKAPVFAMIVSSVGCFQGFRVSGGAESVGRQTTKSVVQAIFLIIVANAVFSIIYSWMGI